MSMTAAHRMLKVHAVSALELSEALCAWQEAEQGASGDNPHPTLSVTGPATRLQSEVSLADYNRRFCAGLLEWLKEV